MTDIYEKDLKKLNGNLINEVNLKNGHIKRLDD